MQQLNKEGAAALRQSSSLIEEEIAEIKGKDEPSDRDRNNMLDLEETKQEILAKIQEIEEMQAQVSERSDKIHAHLIIILPFCRPLRRCELPWTVTSSP